MGYFNRFILFLYALAIAALSLGAVVICLHIVPMYALTNELKYLLSRQETLIGAGVFFLLSIYLLGCSISSGGSGKKNEKDILLIKGASGVVKVAVDAVKSLVEKTAVSLQGVREAKAEISAQNRNNADPVVSVVMHVSLGPDQNVVAVSDTIREAVIRDLEQVAGITEHSVNVIVSDISNAAVSKKKRVV